MAGVIGDIDGALRDLASYTETHRQFVELFEAGDSSPGRLVGQLIAHQRRIDVRLQELTRLLARRSSEVVNRTEKAQRDALFAVVGLSGVAFGLGLLLLFSINFTLRPIGRLTAAAERIREGQLDARAPEESSDEVGRLARTFNEMAAALEERERRLEERSRELEAALADLQASQEALIRSERLATIGRMAAQIAHEVRNPLNALGLNADMLAEELSEPGSSDAARTLAAIRAEIDRLTEITEDYLALGRLPPLRLERQPLSNLVEELVRFQGQELDGVGVEVELDLDAADSEVLVDAGQMRQALLNLVRNAAEALAENGGGHLRIGSESRGGEVVLLIADDGPGMGEAHVAQVFDPFFSTKERGSGLGLPLTHHVISEHGGRIDCKSQVGEGTTFRIFLPEAEAAAGLDNPSTEGAA
jgi:signal transduction histidine kinase